MSDRNADEQARRAQDRAGDQLAAKLVKIADQAKAVRQTGFKVPVLDDDPAATDPTNVWLFGDGQLNSRTPDGTIYRYPPWVAPAPNRPPVPTFTTNPSVATGWKLWFHSGTGELRGRLANNNIVVYVPFTPDSSTDGGEPPTPPAPPPTSTVPKPPNPTPQKFTREYGTTWQRMFCSKHGLESGAEVGYFGDLGSGFHGERKLMFGFDDAQIRSDTSGATIRKVELRARTTHAWSHGGVDIHFGAHNKSAAPSSYSAVRRNVWDDHWPKAGWGGGDDRWRTLRTSAGDLSTWLGRQFRDNNIKGLTVHQPSRGKTYYGRLDPDSIRLRITYTKIP